MNKVEKKGMILEEQKKDREYKGWNNYKIMNKDLNRNDENKSENKRKSEDREKQK